MTFAVDAPKKKKKMIELCTEFEKVVFYKKKCSLDRIDSL